MLQATPGTESNLLTITKDGQVYSYILKYANKLSKLNYFITENESIGNEKPKKIKLKPEVEQIDKYKRRNTDFQKFSEYLLNSKLERVATKRKNRIRLQLQIAVYNTSEVYLVIEIDYLNIYRTNGNKNRKASYQRLQQKVIYKYKRPSIIKNK